jgi:hypothetical protein
MEAQVLEANLALTLELPVAREPRSENRFSQSEIVVHANVMLGAQEVHKKG